MRNCKRIYSCLYSCSEMMSWVNKYTLEQFCSNPTSILHQFYSNFTAILQELTAILQQFTVILQQLYSNSTTILYIYMYYYIVYYNSYACVQHQQGLYMYIQYHLRSAHVDSLNIITEWSRVVCWLMQYWHNYFRCVLGVWAGDGTTFTDILPLSIK